MEPFRRDLGVDSTGFELSEDDLREIAQDWTVIGPEVKADQVMHDWQITDLQAPGAPLVPGRVRREPQAGKVALDRLPPPPRAVVEGLLPEGRLHLIAGASGSGKTTVTFQLWEAFQKGEPWFGRMTLPVDWAYISGDRSADSVYDTMRRLGISFPVFSLVDENLVGEDLIGKILTRLPKFFGGLPNFIYIDGFTALVPGGYLNSYSIVAKWLAALQRFCSKKGVTILGACHTTKVKEGEKFVNPRQRIAGSVAWAGFSDTVILVDADDEEGSEYRTLGLLPRNGKEEFVRIRFDDTGKLILAENADKAVSAAAGEFLFDNLLEQYLPGDEVYSPRLQEAAAGAGIKTRTFWNYVETAVAAGKLVKVRRGVYAKGQEGSVQ